MTDAEFAILSLVAEQPRHGYEIEQVIEERGMREWTEVGFSSIYYLLKKLERAGLIESELKEAARGPARKVYRSTPEGNEALRGAVIDTLSHPRPLYPSLQLGLANLPLVSTVEALEALRQYRSELTSRLEHVRQRYDSQQPLPDFVAAVFEHGIALIEAELGWLESFINHLEG